MKNKRRYVLFVFCLAAVLLLNTFSMLSITAEGESVFVSDLLLEQPERMTEYTGWKIIQDGQGGYLPGLNTDCNGNPIKLKGKYYAKGVGTHSAEEGLSYLEIDLKDLNYEYFTAIVGMADEQMDQEVERNRAGFIVEVDGTEVKRTDLLMYDSDPVEISVSVKGANTLTLALDPGDMRYSDLAIWANAKLSNDPAVDKTASDAPIETENKPTPPPIEDNMIFLSDYLKNDSSKLLQYTGYDPVNEESPSPGLDTAYDGEMLKMYGILYAKGIGMHSNSDLDTETILEIDIKDAGFTQFTATVGMYDSNWPQEVERNVAGFIVLVDGKQVYSSDLMYYDTKPEEISVSLAGASTLTLQHDPNLTPYSDNAIWANALLIKGTSVATPTPAPTQEATATTTATATAKVMPTKTAAPTQKVSGEGGLSTTWIVIIIVAAVVVAGIVIAVILILKKRKNDSPKK